MDPFVASILEAGSRHDATRMYNVNTVRGEMYKTLAPVLSKFDILITPTLCVPAVKADHSEANPDFSINGKKVPAYLGWLQTYPFNLMSQCPVASVPSGTSKSGVPTGLQIIAKTYDDMSVFRAASAFEAARPWRGNRPNV
jgi:Asp-tRNA(Asn)/Glu-tRNA(Gln) amidotransferase A subunit family amidase